MPAPSDGRVVVAGGLVPTRIRRVAAATAAWRGGAAEVGYIAAGGRAEELC